MASKARGPSTAMAWKWGEVKCALSSQASRMGAALAGEVSLLLGTLGPPMYRTNWSPWWAASGKMVMVEEEKLHPSTLQHGHRVVTRLQPIDARAQKFLYDLPTGPLAAGPGW